MVKFINRTTGTEMYVDESRAEEYKKAGHKLAPKKAGGRAAKNETPAETPEEESAKEE